MAGCWETSESVLVGILHTEVTTLAWSFGLRNLIVPGEIMPVAGMPYDHARNVVCMRALEMGVDAVFFLDADVIAPPNTILRLLAHKKPFISGVYHRRSPPVGVPVMIKNGGWVTQYPANTVMEVDLVGAGCLLMRRELLEQMPPIRPDAGKHWFSWQVDLPQTPANQGWNLSEDFTMNRWIREKMGIPILVDTGLQCKHVGFSEVTYAKMDALHCNVHT